MNDAISNTETGDAERAVLGSILLTNGKVLDDLYLTEDDFYNINYGKAFELMRRMHNEGQPVDVITFTSDKRFKAVPMATVMDCHEWTSYVPTASSATFYAQIVKESSVRRRLETSARMIIHKAKSVDFQDLTEFARSDIDKALGVSASTVAFVEDEMGATLDEMNEPSSAYPTPWRALTEAIGGFRPACLYIIGARPGIGKTSVGIQSAIELAKYGAVAFSSLEMRRQEIHKRIISAELEIPMDSVMNNRLYEADWQKIADYRSKLRPAIAIDDRASVTIQDIRTHVRSVMRKVPISGIIVDYLQLMSTADNRPRHEVVAEFSRQLKIMARDFNVPVIALSQLNRASETRQDRKPSLSDLRESGSIEQDADVVILLHQEETDLFLDVAKNRHGAPTMVKLVWQGHYARAVSAGGF